MNLVIMSSLKFIEKNGHNNHFHIKFNIPDKYLQLMKDPKAFIEEPTPTEAGTKGEKVKPITKNREQYLGKI